MRLAPVLPAAAAALVLLAAPAVAQDAETPEQELETCMTCHADETLVRSLPGGITRRLLVDAEAFGKSVHGGSLRCTDCHPGYGEVPDGNCVQHEYS